MGEKQPYIHLGVRLRKLREQARESVLEVSGAIEVDQSVLERFESGAELPDEDILALLINHFDISDSDAVKLWELAGYSKETDKSLNPEEQLLKQIMMVIPFDNRVAYSDLAHVHVNDGGVVISFATQAGNVQPQTVARVGMSVEQAKKLIKTMESTIAAASRPKIPKALPAPKQNKTKKKSN